jgi:hypothetical protein
MPPEQTGEPGLASPTALLVKGVEDTPQVGSGHAITSSNLRQMSAGAHILDDQCQRAPRDTRRRVYRPTDDFLIPIGCRAPVSIVKRAPLTASCSLISPPKANKTVSFFVSFHRRATESGIEGKGSISSPSAGCVTVIGEASPSRPDFVGLSRQRNHVPATGPVGPGVRTPRR